MSNEKPWSEETTALCPECLRTAPAVIREEDGRVWMDRDCPRHGPARALVASDSAEYLRLRRYVPPRVSSGCCGAGETCDSGPPVCVLLLEITQACNLRCPTCYADAHGHDFMPIDDVRGRLDAFFLRQQTLDVLMLSGGEPTIHPKFAEILSLAVQYPIGRVVINTNGLRLYQRDALVEVIAAHRRRLELYFSLASFRPGVHQRLYGRDLRIEKQGALERARQAGIYVNLVPTLERGVNEDEIGDLYRFSLSMDNVTGITFQPVMTAGRYKNSHAPEMRLTLTDVLRELETQTAGALRTTDFVGLPCSHPDCCALTYGFLDSKRETITPLSRHLDVARYIDLVSDRFSFEGILSSAARRVWSDVIHFRAGRTLRDLASLFARSGIREAVALRRDRDAVARRIFRIVVKPFMDAHTYDHQRIEQCCTMVLTEDGVPVSFCEYNVFHRSRRPHKADIALTAV